MCSRATQLLECVAEDEWEKSTTESSLPETTPREGPACQPAWATSVYFLETCPVPLPCLTTAGGISLRIYSIPHLSRHTSGLRPVCLGRMEGAYIQPGVAHGRPARAVSKGQRANGRESNTATALCARTLFPRPRLQMASGAAAIGADGIRSSAVSGRLSLCAAALASTDAQMYGRTWGLQSTRSPSAMGHCAPFVKQATEPSARARRRCTPGETWSGGVGRRESEA